MRDQSIGAKKRQAEPQPATHEELRTHDEAFVAARKSGEKLPSGDERQHPWPRKHRIYWVAERLRETGVDISQYSDDETEVQALIANRTDFAIWLLHERHGLSFPKIAWELDGRPDKKLWVDEENAKQRAFQAYRRVERDHPGSIRWETAHPELIVPVGTDAEETALSSNCCPNCGFPLL